MSMFNSISSQLSSYPSLDRKNYKYFPQINTIKHNSSGQFSLHNDSHISVASSQRSTGSSKIAILNQHIQGSQERRRSLSRKIKQAYRNPNSRTNNNNPVRRPVQYYPRQSQQLDRKPIIPIIQTNRPILNYGMSPQRGFNSPVLPNSPPIIKTVVNQNSQERFRSPQQSYKQKVGAVKKDQKVQQTRAPNNKQKSATLSPRSPIDYNQQLKTGGVLQRNIGLILVAAVMIMLIIFILR